MIINMKYVNIQKDQFNVFLAQTLQEMLIFFMEMIYCHERINFIVKDQQGCKVYDVKTDILLSFKQHGI